MKAWNPGKHAHNSSPSIFDTDEISIRRNLLPVPVIISSSLPTVCCMQYKVWTHLYLVFSLWCVDEYRLQLCSEGVIECLLPRDHTPVEGLLVLRHSRSGSYQMWTAGISLFWWRIYTLGGLEKTKCNYSSDHIGTRLMILCFLQSLSTFSTALECFDQVY